MQARQVTGMPGWCWLAICWLSSCGVLGVSDVAQADPAHARSPAPRRPNVIVILSDDQGWGDLSLNGNRNLATPNIDSLATEGVAFDRFFVCPVCSPTRAEFLTGRYHPRSGVYSTSAGGERMDLDERTIAELFRQHGYATAAFGKWHNGMQYPYHPNARGFDEFYGFCSGHWGNYFSPMLEHNGRIVNGSGFVIDDFTTRALEFIERHRDSPFLVYLPYNTPHSPMQVPDEYWNRFRDKPLEMRHREADREDLQHTRAALAMCENIDWNVGRILKRLEELRLRDDTIVVYFCDNGPNGFRFNGAMKGRKGSTDEGGVRSPLLIRWPGTLPAGQVVKPIAGAIDLLPTLAELAGLSVPASIKLDGMSLKAWMLEPHAHPTTDRMLFSHWRNRVSVRTQRFRLDHQGKLFDMQQDPEQRHDASQQFPEIHQRLTRAVRAWEQDVLAGYDQDDRPFVLGHPDAPTTQLPARDATAHGQLKRSNRFPNCSYFGNWKRLEDSLTWDVEVPESGEFDVAVFYTLRPGNEGTRLKLSFRGEQLESVINEAHWPPVLGADQDRVPRMESYVKSFRRLELGTLKLTAGAGELKLQATKIPGEESIEFRLLLFTPRQQAGTVEDSQ